MSRKIEYLVHKRHRSLRHIQKAITDEGCFWMNSVQINRKVVHKIIHSQFSLHDLKAKTDRFYYLGFSLGKIIDLGNAVNTIYTLLQLFEEFEAYTRQIGGQSLETNAILRHILPQNIESFAKLQQTQDMRQQQLEEYVDTLSLSTQDVYAGSDFVETVRKPALQEIQPSVHLRGNHASQGVAHQEETKLDAAFKSSLPMQEQHYNNYEEYIMKTSNVSHNLADPNGRVHASKVDPKAPSFRVFSCHSIPVTLDYCQVTTILIDMLMLVYNKMYDNQFLNAQMITYVERIDNIIVNKIIKALCEDINRVARLMAIKQLAKLNKALKMDHNPAGKTELKKVSSEDDLFQIAALDLDGNNKQDMLLLNSVAGGTQGNSVRTSSDRVGLDLPNAGNYR